ncbi:alcohol dehydrogenase catalytic domain-containing protein [Microbacterium sp. NIBRBAC000506063]|uniref:alcohol dehydrogenase catalytic domain-containing protein n=1 Tax=Microbacterium sp. NIBRBAC000506063 TaxID=2734618 RepID=UPI001CB70CE4|nr:hypothetical protein [Microbacterium sp. NIBRBAC000506063]
MGFDGAGVVSAVGEGITAFSVGDRVAIGWGAGTYATSVVVDAAHAALIPDEVTAEEGAGIGIPRAPPIRR